MQMGVVLAAVSIQVPELTQQMFDAKNMLLGFPLLKQACSCSQKQCPYLASRK